MPSIRFRRHLAALVLVVAAWATPAARADDQEAERPTKKAEWLRDKAARKDVRAGRAPRMAPLLVLSLHNLWTGETLPVPDTPQATSSNWDRFLRCHHTNQTTSMDLRLLGLVRAAADRFRARLVEIVSGFRAPKYNLMLRKKGHDVARDSQHTYGHAIDFRIAGVPTKTLRRFVLAHRLGGVGYYPRSQFVHADTGPVRTWTE